MKQYSPDYAIKNRADNCISQGALTNSKRLSTFIDGVYPSHASHGLGAVLYANKKPFIDYYGALGSNLFGYGNRLIGDAIVERFHRGATMSLSSETEVEAAEALKSVFNFDLWKFGKNGSDVCNASIKIARAYTRKDLVLSDGYHGNGDDFISMSPPALGIPKRNWILPLEDNWDLIPHAACVIIEPVVLDYSRDRLDYLKRLREECTKHNTVLIYDEIITGFRFKKLSVSNCFNIQPDIILLGKVMGGGLALSAMGGRKEMMNCGEYFYSGTFFGETCSLAACIKILSLLKSDKYKIDNLWAQGDIFLNKFNELSDQVKIVGYPTRGSFVGDELTKSLLWQEACKAGILFGPSWFFNFALPEHTDIVISTCKDIIGRIKTNSVKLEGKMPVKTFSQKQRE